MHYDNVTDSDVLCGICYQKVTTPSEQMILRCVLADLLVRGGFQLAAISSIQER